MKRLTFKKDGLWHFISYFNFGAESFLIKSTIDQHTVDECGLDYIVNTVYKKHDITIKAGKS